jgi:hypothetical protein
MGVGVVLLVALGVGLGLADSLGSRDRDRRPDATPSAAMDQSGSLDRDRRPDATPSAATDHRDLREIVEGLRESLEEQIRRHEELRTEVAQMGAGMSGAAPIAASEVRDEENAERKETPHASGWHAGGPAEGFDDGVLFEAGLHPSDAERLREAWEGATFEQMALRDAARREGWFGKERYRTELNAIRSDLREELGENGFDALLFATGQSNRILVTGVIDRSSAAYAGFEKGDQILRYAGRRVFTPRELNEETASGVSGTTVPVEVLRRGRSETLSVRRGPLGVVTSIVRAPPVGG